MEVTLGPEPLGAHYITCLDSGSAARSSVTDAWRGDVGVLHAVTAVVSPHAPNRALYEAKGQRTGHTMELLWALRSVPTREIILRGLPFVVC